MAEIIPQRLAVRFDPPTLVVEEQTPRGLRHHKLRLKAFKQPGADPAALAATLRARYPRHFMRCAPAQVTRLVALLVQHAPAPPQINERPPGDRPEDVNLLAADLQAVPEHVLAQAKAAMSEVFEATVLRPGDPGFLFDKRVDFNTDDASESSWDS
jgi:centrosomal protein CEP19